MTALHDPGRPVSGGPGVPTPGAPNHPTVDEPAVHHDPSIHREPVAQQDARICHDPLGHHDALSHHHPEGHQRTGHGRGHGVMMLACCVPMLLIAFTVVATGAVGSGAIFFALLCTAMMGAMMFAMPRHRR